MPGTDIVRAGSSIVVGVGVKGADAFGKSFKTMGKQVGSFADLAMSHYKGLGILFTTVGGGIMAAGNQILAGTKDFEAAMRNVQTVSQSARVDFQKMSTAVMQIGQKTNTAAAEAAKGMYQIVSSGFDGAEALNVLNASLIAASAGLTDADTAARSIGAVLNAYAMDASEAGDVSDILFQTVNLGVGTFEELAGAVGDVAGIAAQVGVPFDQIAAAIAAASRAGQNFDEAATGVNRILQDLLDPTESMIMMLQQMGFESGQAALQQMGLKGVMEAIRSRVGDNAAAYVSLFGRIEAVKTGLALAASEGENYADVSDQITSKTARANAAQKAFNIQMKGMNAQAKQLRNSFYIFAQSGLFPLLTLLEKSGSAGAKFFDALGKLHPALKTLMVVGTLAAGAMLLLTGLLLLALPKAIIIAAVLIWRMTMSHKSAAWAAIQHAAANNLFVKSVLMGTKFLTNFNAGLSIMRSGARFGALIGSLGMIAVAFDSFWVSSETVAKGMERVTDSMSDEEVSELAESYAKLINKEHLLSTASGVVSANINKVGQVIDKVAQTHFSLYTMVGEATEAFKKLAASNPVAAARLIESAKAAGVNEYAIYKMKLALWDAKVAQEETTEATGIGASKFMTSSGAMIMLSDDLKDKLDALKDSADDIAGAFGGMFGDAEEQLNSLTEASRSAGEAVRDAQKNVTEATEGVGKAHTQSAREQEKNSRDLIKAERELEKLRTRKPKRQRGEKRDDYEVRIADELADAEETVADMRARIADQGDDVTQALDKETEATSKLTEAKKKEAEANTDLIITGDKLLERIKNQQKAQLDFFNNVSKLRQRLGAPGAMMMTELVAKGPKEGGMEAAALASLDDTKLKDYLGTWKDIQAISTGVALGDTSKILPEEINTYLEQLWTQVGGDVGKLLEYGAGAGEEALRNFIAKKMPNIASNIWDPVKDKAVEVLSNDYELMIKAVFADDSVRIPGLTAPLDEFAGLKITVPVVLAPTEAPTVPEGYEEKEKPWWQAGSAGAALDALMPDMPTVIESSPLGRYIPKKWGGTKEAEGGIENHQAMIGKGITRIWDEPETGGEAYIPLAKSKRDRSEGILSEVAGIFGGSFQKFADGGIRGGHDPDAMIPDLSRFNAKPALSLGEQAKKRASNPVTGGYMAAHGIDALVSKVKDVPKKLPDIWGKVGGQIGGVLGKSIDKFWKAKGLEMWTHEGIDYLVKIGGEGLMSHGYGAAQRIFSPGVGEVQHAMLRNQLANLGRMTTGATSLAGIMYEFGKVPTTPKPDSKSINVDGIKLSLPSHTSFHDWRVQGDKIGSHLLYGPGNKSIDISQLAMTPRDVYNQMPKEKKWWGLQEKERRYDMGGIVHQAMLPGGLAFSRADGGVSTTDSSTHIQHSYSVGQVVTPDPAAFERWAANRQRMSNLAGV